MDFLSEIRRRWVRYRVITYQTLFGLIRSTIYNVGFVCPRVELSSEDPTARSTSRYPLHWWITNKMVALPNFYILPHSTGPMCLSSSCAFYLSRAWNVPRVQSSPPDNIRLVPSLVINSPDKEYIFWFPRLTVIFVVLLITNHMRSV